MCFARCQGRKGELRLKLESSGLLLFLLEGLGLIKRGQLTGICSVRCRQTTGDSFDTLDVLCICEVCSKFSKNTMEKRLLKLAYERQCPLYAPLPPATLRSPDPQTPREPWDTHSIPSLPSPCLSARRYIHAQDTQPAKHAAPPRQYIQKPLFCCVAVSRRQ